MPGVLSFLAYGTFGSTVQGLNGFPVDQWPDSVELVYYSYHIMVGLGTLMTLVMIAAAVQLARGKLAASRALLWTLMLASPFRISPQPQVGGPPSSVDSRGVVYGLLRHSPC